MINYEMFHLLKHVKSGDGTSWKNIYQTIEILIAITLGGNGFGYLTNMDGYFDSKRSASIFDSDYHWTGKFK